MAWIRGAICAENTVDVVKTQTLKLFGEIISQNNLNTCHIQAVFFTVTKDINICYPAKFIRETYPELCNIAFMCAQEMDVVGSLPQCIRICVYTEQALEQREVSHCYLDGAESLRPDLKR